jgi:hypothetical protein
MSHNPERELFQTVIHKAFVDATAAAPSNAEDQREKRRAHDWISGCGRDFRFICRLAGMDADFLSDAYRAGRVDPARLRAGEPIKTGRAAA